MVLKGFDASDARKDLQAGRDDGRSAWRSAAGFLLLGNNADAVAALGEFWPGVGARPDTAGLAPGDAAPLLFCCGALTGRLGWARQIAGSQEAAKDILGEAARLASEGGMPEIAAAARIELGLCYFHEGSFDDARALYGDALSATPEDSVELRCLALLRLAGVDLASQRPESAVRILTESGPLFESCPNEFIRGAYHADLGSSLQLAAAGREEFIDRAVVEYTAAAYHFGRVGNTRNLALTENNLGLLLSGAGRLSEAHEHFSEARRLFASIEADAQVAQVDDSRARAHIAAGEYARAEQLARSAARELGRGDAFALFAEASTTWGVALARLGRVADALAAFARARAAAERAGDLEGAGLAALTAMEEAGAAVEPAGFRELYIAADSLLSTSQRPDVKARLLACARRALEPTPAPAARAPEESGDEGEHFAHASDAARELLAHARQIAPSAAPVLIQGETGTGKEVLARMIHAWSGRTGDLVVVNCASLSDELFESQIFGHTKGSFTGATHSRQGMALRARGGTLFLDEIADLSPANQVKLLRLVERGEISPVGADEPARVDVRIVAATNRSLDEAVAAGRFRRDLLYRLAAFDLHIPPLRERADDIPSIARHFVARMEARYGRRVLFPEATIEALRALPLPGNARELRTLIERAFVSSPEGATVTPETVALLSMRRAGGGTLADPWRGVDLRAEVAAYEREIIRAALAASGGEITRAARLLKTSHQTLNSKIKSSYPELLAERKPVKKRHRSIIRKDCRPPKSRRQGA